MVLFWTLEVVRTSEPFLATRGRDTFDFVSAFFFNLKFGLVVVGHMFAQALSCSCVFHAVFCRVVATA